MPDPCPPRVLNRHTSLTTCTPDDDALVMAQSTHLSSHVRLTAYERLVRAQQEQIKRLTDDLAAADLHAGMVALENEELQLKLNSKNSQTRRTRTLVTEARCFTSSSGLIAWRAQEAERLAKEAAKQAKKTAREEKARRLAAERSARGNTFTFTGGLSKQRAADLQDIVKELGIILDPSVKRPTCDYLRKEIVKYFDQHPERRDEDRYRGLFKQSAPKRSAPANRTDENMPPSDSLIPNDDNEPHSRRRRLDLDGRFTPIPPTPTPRPAYAITHQPSTPFHTSGPSRHPFTPYTPFHGSNTVSTSTSHSSTSSSSTVHLSFEDASFTNMSPNTGVPHYPYSYMYHTHPVSHISPHISHSNIQALQPGTASADAGFNPQ